MQYVHFSCLLDLVKIEKFLMFAGCCHMRAPWQKVMPVLRSWRILVPMKSSDGFDSALVVLEKMVYAPEQLSWRLVASDT
jgi:hypothetical protein